MAKIVTKQEFKTEIRPAIKRDKQTIALCHGVFDLIHPGHIIHFQQAKQMADVLVVSITSAEFVRKGPGRPYFNNEQRMNFLSAIDCIDYVLLSEGYTVDDIVENVEPDIYVKGSEYAREEDDVTGMMTAERLLVEKHGGVVRYTTGEVFSSTKLINTAMSGLPREVIDFMTKFKENHGMENIKKMSDAAVQLKVLVIGDTIIDRYTYCDIQGLMSKDMAYSARVKSSEDYLGGAIAIARHLASFSKHVTLMSVIGDEAAILDGIRNEIGDKVELELYQSSEIPTIIKQRYVVKNQKREEYKKIFAANNIVLNRNYEQVLIDRFVERLEQSIEDYDVVFLCDFGHGLIGSDIMRIAQQKAKYLVLNCQTNSTNKGRNIITKYDRADAFSLDQGELSLAYPAIVTDEKDSLQKLCKRLGGAGWLTRGSNGAYGVDLKTGDIVHECPAFTLNVTDTIGAGDAFFAVAGLFSALGATVEEGMFLGNIAGALGANIVGNKDAVEKANVLKYASTLFNV
ncbi:MAG: cytidyltransferase [Lachnospiraceae bacterium]|nr:cytidyltransferase [Lachnospiraceae bacterium]